MEKKLAADDTLNKEYLPVLGLEQFTNAATSMLLGANNKAIVEGRVSFFYTLYCIFYVNECPVNTILRFLILAIFIFNRV